jgi:hypothetical protein
MSILGGECASGECASGECASGECASGECASGEWGVAGLNQVLQRNVQT